MKDYGGALKSLRKRMGLTQAQLAERLSVTYQAVSKWENNKNQPDLESLEKICKTFSVTVDEFLRLAENSDAVDEKSESAKADDEKREETAGTAPQAYGTAPQSQPIQPKYYMSPQAKKKYDRQTKIICAWVAAAFAVLCMITATVAVVAAQNHKSSQTIYNEVNRSVFGVRVETASGTDYGSGFFIDKKGTAVTYYGLIENAKSASVILSDGSTHMVDEIVGVDAVHGLAVIRVRVKSSKPVKIAGRGKVKAGDRVCAIGYTLSTSYFYESKVMSGRISETNYDVGGNKYIRTDFDFSSINRGGVLLNSGGKAIGVIIGQSKIGGMTYTDLGVPSAYITKVGDNVNLSVNEHYTLRNKKVKITYMLDGKKYAEYDVKGIDDHKPPTPMNAYGKFDGWYTSSDYTDKYEFTGKFSEDITLYGRFVYTRPVLSLAPSGSPDFCG